MPVTGLAHCNCLKKVIFALVDAPTHLYTRLRPSVCPSVRLSIRLSVHYAFVKTAENGQFRQESVIYLWEGHKSRFIINRSLIQSLIQSLI